MGFHVSLGECNRSVCCFAWMSHALCWSAYRGSFAVMRVILGL